MRLNDKVAIITGAGRNIGEEIAKIIVDEGAKVAVVDLDKGRGETVAGEIDAVHQGRAPPVVCDVSSGVDVENMVKTVVQKWGGVDILVNNAAWTDHKNIFDLTEEEWDKVMGITLKSVFFCTKFAAKVMVDQKHKGRIINIASTSGHWGRPEATAYTWAPSASLRNRRGRRNCF